MFQFLRLDPTSMSVLYLNVEDKMEFTVASLQKTKIPVNPTDLRLMSKIVPVLSFSNLNW